MITLKDLQQKVFLFAIIKLMIKNSQNQTGSAHAISIIVVIAVILGVLGYVAWNNFGPKSDNSTVQETKSTQSTEEVADTDPDNKTFEIKEMGISLLLPDSLSDDLVYSYSDDSAGFSTKYLTENYPSCAASQTPPLGYLHKVSGVYPEDPNVTNAKGLLVKQFDTYYIGYSSPQAVCTTEPIQDSTDIMTPFKESLSTIKEL